MEMASQAEAGRCGDRALLEALAKRRGFVWQAEVGEPASCAIIDGGVDVLDPHGKVCGRLALESGDRTGDPLLALLEPGDHVMDAEQRSHVLGQLHGLCARVVNVLASYPRLRPLVQPAQDVGAVSAVEGTAYAREEAVDVPQRVFRRAVRALRRGVVDVPPPVANLVEQAATQADKYRARLFIGNLRLVAAWAGRRYLRGMAFSDAIRVGSNGLLRAIDRFDVERGLQLSTYATWWIRQAIDRAVADHHAPLRLPVHRGEKVRRVWKFTAAFWREHGRQPTRGEVAQAAGFTARDVDQAFAAVLPVVHEQRSGAVGLTVWDLLWDPRRPLPIDVFPGPEVCGRLTLLARALADPMHGFAGADASAKDKAKAERLAEVLNRRWGIGLAKKHTLKAIGADMAVTRERIRQIESKALTRLREPARRVPMDRLLSAAEQPLDEHGGD